MGTWLKPLLAGMATTASLVGGTALATRVGKLDLSSRERSPVEPRGPAPPPRRPPTPAPAREPPGPPHRTARSPLGAAIAFPAPGLAVSAGEPAMRSGGAPPA